MSELEEELIQKIANRKAEILEAFSEAYIAETGLKPSEVILHQCAGQDPFKAGLFNMKWWFEPKPKGELHEFYEKQLEAKDKKIAEIKKNVMESHPSNFKSYVESKERIEELESMLGLCQKFFKPPCVDDRTKCVCSDASFTPDFPDPGHIEPECCFYRDISQLLAKHGKGGEG